jgi:polyribonucleotide nucleotidyltransferase
MNPETAIPRGFESHYPNVQQLTLTSIGDPNGHSSHMTHYGVPLDQTLGQPMISQTIDEYHGIEETVPTIAPTYDDIFPALPESAGPEETPIVNTVPNWSSRHPKIKPSNITQVFRVAPEERKYREINSRFGEQAEQAKICADIMQKTGAHIEMSVSKDGTLTFLITGKEDAVLLAKRNISSELQTQASLSVPIPKEHHRFILGKGGQKLSDLEQKTGTKIYMPRQNDSSTDIKIIGTKEAIDKALHEIQLISNEMASRANERVSIPKIYHPFICGPFNSTLEQIMKESGAKVSVPPPSVNKEEISITGEKDAVLKAKDRILRIYNDKEKKCQTVSMEVRKSQHKYIIGPKGQTLNEIFEKTGVSIEMPSTDSTSETITLRGEQEKLGPALTVLYEKAHSEVDAEIAVPSWYHKYILGPKGSKFNEISQDFQKVNVSFVANEDKIKMHGPIAEVEKAKEVINEVIREIKNKIQSDEIKVDSRYHRFIIGKNGVNIKHIREETGAQIHIPSESAEHLPSNDVIRIEGSPQSVAKARKELEVIIKKMVERENEVSKDLMVEQRFHRQIIGTKGDNIREIRERFNQVVIIFPEPNEKSDRVTIKGSKKDVDQCYKHLSQLNKELLSNNYRVEVPIYKQFHKYIIGKGGANIKKIRDETSTRIDLPAEGADSDVIVITGTKANVEIARDRIQAIENEMEDVVNVDIMVPAKIHNYIIGAKGRQIKQIMDECGGVLIRFPPEGSGSDKVSIRGPKDCVQKAKQQLIAISNEQQTNNFSEELKVKPEHHRYLIGKNGANIRKVREQTGARILFPSANEESPTDKETVIITGKKEEVSNAKQMLKEMIDSLEKVVEGEMKVDPKHHKHFVARRGAILKQIGDEFGGVTISFPRSRDRDSDRVVLKGSKECVESAKQRIAAIVEDLESQITIECVIDSKYHRTLMGSRGSRVQAITQTHDVKIKFPERGTNGVAAEDSSVNGDYNGSTESLEQSEKTHRKSDIILITGKKENCESAQNALMALIPITIEVEVPFDLHRFIIGQKGREVRELMDKYDVSITVPPANASSDIIKITGSKDNVENAKTAIEERVVKIESDKQEKLAKSFTESIKVNPIFHPKIIGKRGAIITKIRDKYKVQIQFPELKRRDSHSEDEKQDIITIIGYENDVYAAKEDILARVRELEELVHEEVFVDSRVHPRLIGAKGKTIRKIMDQFNVDIRFPRSDGNDPNVVVISGMAENVDEAKDHILNLAEEYMDDVVENIAPSRQLVSDSGRPKQGKGFVVKGGPWEQSNQTVPDTSDAQEFPSFGNEMSGSEASPAEEGSRSTPWGPKTGRQ